MGLALSVIIYYINLCTNNTLVFYFYKKCLIQTTQK